MNEIVKTHLFRKNFIRKDGTRQLKILVKIGYITLGHFTEKKRYEIKVLNKKRKLYTVSDEEYAYLKDKVSNERLYLYGLEKKIQYITLHLLKNKEAISSSIIFNKLYEIENIIQKNQKLKEWNEFFTGWGVEISSTSEMEEVEKELNKILSNDEILLEEDLAGVVQSIQLAKAISKENERIKKMDFNTRYQNGYFDKNNIYEVFGYLWSRNPNNGDPYIPTSYRSLMLQLNDYRFRASPSPLVREFNSKWVDDFFKYLVKEGYPNVQIKRYDPFNIVNYKEHIINAERTLYKVQTFEKIVKHFKRYLRLLVDQGLIKYDKDISLISAKKYLSRNVIKDNFTKKEFSLTPKEYNLLATHDFNNERLNLARDMFIIMVQGGGFRANEIFKYVKVQNNEITVYRPKKKEVITNPIWGHLADVIDRHMGIPKELLSVNDFRSALKEIAKILNFDRTIIRPNTRIHSKDKKDMTLKDEVEELKIMDVFNPEFARKTIVRYLATVKEMKDEDIIEFTSHSSVKTLKHYKNRKTIVEKFKLIE
jgi:hypothetical protein